MNTEIKKLSQYLLIFFTISFCQSGISSELKERQVIQNQVIDALDKKEFKKLEKLAIKYRSETKRTSSGLYPLTFFYLGMTNYSGWTAKDPDGNWKQQKAQNEKWIKKYPNSPTPYIAQAIHLEQMAYRYRIANYDRAVTPKEMVKSEKLMQLAYSLLMKNKAIAVKDPHWYVEMIRIATGQGWEEKKYMQLVDEAVNKYPMYYQIYFAAVDYYSPKFGGNIKLMDKFARYAVNHTKDEIGMTLYARIYWAAFQSWSRKSVLAEINWKDFKSGVDTVLKRYPDDWNANNFALFACMAGDKEKAKDLLGKINKPFIKNVWGSLENYNACKNAAGYNEARGKSVI